MGEGGGGDRRPDEPRLLIAVAAVGVVAGTVGIGASIAGVEDDVDVLVDATSGDVLQVDD